MKKLNYISLTGHESTVTFKSEKDATSGWKKHLEQYGGWMKIGRRWLDKEGTEWGYGKIRYTIEGLPLLLHPAMTQ